MNALNAYNKLNANVAGLKKSSEKLSSGYRINRAGDDAAGLAISEKMRSQIKGLNQAVRNSQDGINMIQTFEGAAQESHSILQRMKELADESANGTYQSEVDRDAIQLEFDQLNDELNQIADTDFNGVVALNGGRMADGTKLKNASDQSTLPTIQYTQNAGDDKTIIYEDRVNGSFAADGRTGQITINGKRYDITLAPADGKATVKDSEGKTAATAPTNVGDPAKVELTDNFVKDGAFTANGKITVTEMLAADDEGRFTYNGKEYIVDGTAVKLWDAESNKAVAITAAEEGITFTVADGKITAVTVYDVASDGALTRGTKKIAAGSVRLGDKVSEPNSYKHGARNLTYTDALTLQAGARSKDSIKFTFSYNTSGIGNLRSDMDISARGLGTDKLSVATQEQANFAIDQIDNAINKVSMVRATFGAAQNRLEHKITNLTTNSENLQEAESAIRDTDMASEMMNYTKFNILQQAAQSMLAQANQQPQSILQLLG